MHVYTLREIIGIIYSGLYGNNTCDNFYGIFARFLRNFYLTTGNNRLAKVCLRGPRLLAELFSIDLWKNSQRLHGIID